MVAPDVGVIGSQLTLQRLQQHRLRYWMHVVGTVPERLRNIREVSCLPSHHRGALQRDAIGADKLATERRLTMPTVEIARRKFPAIIAKALHRQELTQRRVATRMEWARP